MSKGRKPNDNNRPDVVTLDTESDDGIVIDEEPICWQFPLEETNSSVNTISVGVAVIGSIHDKRILVRGDSQALGFAPSDTASKVIEATLKKKAKLNGTVLSILDDSNSGNGINVWVELCLR